jgi:hypothetical protein
VPYSVKCNARCSPYQIISLLPNAVSADLSVAAAAAAAGGGGGRRTAAEHR